MQSGCRRGAIDSGQCHSFEPFWPVLCLFVWSHKLPGVNVAEPSCTVLLHSAPSVAAYTHSFGLFELALSALAGP